MNEAMHFTILLRQCVENHPAFDFVESGDDVISPMPDQGEFVAYTFGGKTFRITVAEL